jgi:hypothetical protein
MILMLKINKKNLNFNIFLNKKYFLKNIMHHSIKHSYLIKDKDMRSFLFQSLNKMGFSDICTKVMH